MSSAFSSVFRTVPVTTTMGWRSEIDSRKRARFFCCAKRPNRICGSHKKYHDPLSPKMGQPVAQFVEALRYKPKGRGFDSRWCHWNVSLTYSFRPHYGSGVDPAPNRNEYQEYLLGGKGGKAAGAYSRQPYHLHVPIV